MKINKKGFTLIELLAVIGVLGLVLAISTYFIINSITGSKEKAFELSKKGLLDSAITYANEFNEEEDWVDAYPEHEYTCVNAWWLVNKGMQKKEIFTEDQNEKYKFKKSAVIVLERNKDNKVIENAYLPENNEKECKNTLSAEINLTSTYNSITVTGTCKMKGVIQNDENDIEYRFCKTDDNTCVDIPNNKYTFSGLIHNTNYNFSLQCSSKKYGNSSVINASKETLEIPAPSVECSDNNVIVQFPNYNTLTKKVSVNSSNIKYGNNTLQIGETSFTDNLVEFDISNISSTSAEFTAIVEADANNRVTTEATCPKSAIDLEKPEKPYFVSSDGKISNSWHNEDFSLEIRNNSKNQEATIYYKGDNDSNWIRYDASSKINVISDNTYKAKACVGDISNDMCSGETNYIAKLDKTAPTINYTVKHVLSDAEKEIISCNEKELSYELKKQSELSKTYYSYKESEDENIAWLAYNIKIYYSISDQESGLQSNAIYGISSSGNNYITSLTKNSRSLSRTNNNKSAEFNHEINENGYRQTYLKVCDVAGNCTEKNLYFKIDQQAPKITFEEDKGSGNYKFKCESGLAGINRFFGGNSSGRLPNDYPISQGGRVSYGSYWLSDSSNGEAYFTCSSKTHKFITIIPDEYEGEEEGKWGYTGYQPRNLSRIIINGTFTFKKLNGGTCYKWGCPCFGVSNYCPQYTAVKVNPYPEHCGLESEYACGKTDGSLVKLSKTNGYYKFSTFCASCGKWTK